MNEAVDHDARAMAARAEQKIDSHEDRCAERWEQARKEMVGVRDDVAKIGKLLWWGVGGLIAAQFALLMWLMDRIA